MRPKGASTMICTVCGFSTLDVGDMIRHLANIQKYESENCTRKTILVCKKLRRTKQ